MHKLTVATLALAVAAGGCAGANPPLETSAPPLARANADNTPPMVRSMSPQPAELHRLARRLPRARAGPGHPPAGLRRRLPGRRRQRRGGPARQPAGRVHQADLGVPRRRRLAGPRRARAARSARSSTPTLAAIESRYGVDRQAVLAIWGMETNFGGNRGSIPVVESLATLAYEGRRRAFAEEQLVAALRILQAGDVAPRSMVGSWAGAMGHTQFIPTSYLSLRRRLHRRRAARRLVRRPDRRAGLGGQLPREVGLAARPALGRRGAAAGRASTTAAPTSRTAARSSDWRARGVTRSTARPLPDHGPAAIIAPAGARGPAFAVYQNFFVIKRYNNATSYAMGVGHLGDRIMRRRPVRRRLAARRARALAAPRRSSCRSG